MKKPSRRFGFTIVELMIASLLFSMVIAALSAIYATAFGQSGRTFREGRAKAMATLSMRALMREVAQSTRIDLPAKNSSGRDLSGCSNAKSDSTRITTSEPSVRFHFCVRTSNRSSGSCDGNPAELDSAPCLYYYTRSNNGNCAVSDVTSGNCGNTLSVMGTPQLLASGLEAGAGMPANVYFTRLSSQFAQEDNAVRVTYKVTRPPSFNSPKLIYEVDTTASAQFGVRP